MAAATRARIFDLPWSTARRLNGYRPTALLAAEHIPDMRCLQICREHWATAARSDWKDVASRAATCLPPAEIGPRSARQAQRREITVTTMELSIRSCGLLLATPLPDLIMTSQLRAELSTATELPRLCLPIRHRAA